MHVLTKITSSRSTSRKLCAGVFCSGRKSPNRHFTIPLICCLLTTLVLSVACNRNASPTQYQSSHTFANAVQAPLTSNLVQHAENSGSEDNSITFVANWQSADDEQRDQKAELSAAEIFERRMLPILKSSKSSSCSECHFGGVDLRNYILENQTDMFAALRDQGLIDIKNPDESKILQFIARHTDKTDELTERVRKAEFTAFHDWIHAAVKDPVLQKANAPKRKLGGDVPTEFVRHLRRDHVLESFEENIWSEIGRCINCHSPERNQRLIAEHGEQISWIVPNDPAATLQKLVDAGDIDLESPESSSVLLKAAGLEKHGGGPKFTVGSRSYDNFLTFLRDYAAIVKGTYKSADQLPKQSHEIAMLTEQHLRIVDLPAGLDKKILQVNIYRWENGKWSDQLWATAQNPINGEKNEWQNLVTAVAERDSTRSKHMKPGKCDIPPGRYLAKIYIDRLDKQKSDPNRQIDADDFLGQAEFDGDWPPGYQPPKIVKAPR
jgi:hypothetical protein